jgi:hypothetical protein
MLHKVSGENHRRAEGWKAGSLGLILVMAVVPLASRGQVQRARVARILQVHGKSPLSRCWRAVTRLPCGNAKNARKRKKRNAKSAGQASQLLLPVRFYHFRRRDSQLIIQTIDSNDKSKLKITRAKTGCVLPGASPAQIREPVQNSFPF